MHHYIFDIPGNWCEPWNSTHTYIDIYIGHKVVNFSTKTMLLDHLADLYVLGDLDPHQLPLPNILHLHHHSTNKQKDSRCQLLLVVQCEWIRHGVRHVLILRVGMFRFYRHQNPRLGRDIWRKVPASQRSPNLNCVAVGKRHSLRK